MARLHVISLPHTRVEAGFCGCAYTNKTRLAMKMWRDRHQVFLYAPECDPIDGVEVVQCLSDNARLAIFGSDDMNRLPAWPTDAQSALFNATTIRKLQKRSEPHDLVLLVGGLTHKPIRDALPAMMFLEPFVGYEGIFTDKCAFESYAWMHSMYMKWGIHDIRWYDRAIPPFVDPDEFPVLNQGKGDYLLFVGRLISRKGPHIALQIAKAAGMPLYIAGAGGRVEDGKLIGQDVTLEGDVTYIGPVDIQRRAELMAGARAVIVPTTYAEPGGNVAIEAMMAGTPVIAPDWGIFSESVIHGITGFHFRTLKAAVEGIRQAGNFDHQMCRDTTMKRYSLEAVAPKFDAWFDACMDLRGEGWNTL